MYHKRSFSETHEKTNPLNDFHKTCGYGHADTNPMADPHCLHPHWYFSSVLHWVISIIKLHSDKKNSINYLYHRCVYMGMYCHYWSVLYSVSFPQLAESSIQSRTHWPYSRHYCKIFHQLYACIIWKPAQCMPFKWLYPVTTFFCHTITLC